MAAHDAPRGAESPRLADWIPLEQLPKEFPDKLPHLNAALWLVRNYRADMVTAQALCRFGRKIFIHPARFEAAMIAVGVRAAGRGS